MARYYQAPNNPIVDLTPRVPIEFYSKIMEQAQNNLNQANATGAAFMTDLYGQEYIDEAARNKAMADAQAPISQALDRDFVTPATIARAVGQASNLVAPWKNLNTKHLKEAKREQELRDRWGSNYIGNSVLSKKLYNPETGSWINADDIKLTAGNREDLVQALARDNSGRADLKREIEGNWQTILGGKAFEKRNRKVTGLTEAERVAEFVNNQQMAKQYLAQMPEFAKAIAASGVDPVEYMTKEIDQWSKQLVRGEDFDSKYLDNPDYGKSRSNITYTGAPLKAETYDRGVDKLEKSKSSIQSAREFLVPSLVKKDDGALMGNSLVSGANQIGDRIAQMFTGDKNAKLNPLHTLFTDEDFVVSEKKGSEVLKDLKNKYKSIYKSIDKGGDFFKYLPNKTYEPSKLKDQSYRNEVAKARDLAFLDAVEKLESTQYSPLTSYDTKDTDFDKGMDRAIEVGIKSKAKVTDEDGKEVALADLYTGKDKTRRFLPRNDGNLDIVVDGKVHSLDVFDENGVGTGVIGQRAQSVLKVQKQLYDALWETEDSKIFNTAVTYGNTPTPVPVPGFNGTGIPVYTVERSAQIGQPNNIIVTYYDPETGQPHTDSNGSTLSYPTSLAEIAQNTAEILKVLNPNPSKTE